MENRRNPSATTNNAKRPLSSSVKDDSSECTPCGTLLRKVLLEQQASSVSTMSRPRQLLQSMMPPHVAFSWRPLPDGLQVEIPAGVSTSNTNASDASDSSTRQRNGLQRQETHQLATSVAVSSEPKTEWMSISCRKCADTGPESNARAFVMGPTPLSVVVCTNRLQQQQQQPVAVVPVLSKQPSHDSTTIHSIREQEQMREVSEILTHELIHVYDVRTLQLDLQECEQLAYSEVRAAREAECASVPATIVQRRSNPWFASTTSTAEVATLDQKTLCVQQKARAATQNLFANKSHECVQRVLSHAMADTRPWVAPPPSKDTSSNPTPTGNTRPVQISMATAPSPAAAVTATDAVLQPPSSR